MARPVLLIECDGDGEGWKSGGDWKEDLKQELYAAFGDVPVVILPPGAHLEILDLDQILRVEPGGEDEFDEVEVDR